MNQTDDERILYQKKQEKRLMEMEQRGRKKTVQDAQTASFMCLLVYFTIKICTILIYYNYDNYLMRNHQLIPFFMILLIVNTYLMLTTGRDPGYYKKQQQNKPQQHEQSNNLMTQIIQNEILSNQSQNIKNKAQQTTKFCSICQCMERNRMKHCYSCGKCIMKFDHHCPWIGSCVGELNHFKFLLCLIAHTLQAMLSFSICFQSLDYYKYYDIDSGQFSSEYGVFILWTIFMTFYIMFAGGLSLFHFFLIATNQTTKQLMSRQRCSYLKDVKGNPYNEGLVNNFKITIFPESKGRQWTFDKEKINLIKQSFCQWLWSNQYYDCC